MSLRFIHRWVGLGLCGFVLVISLTGTLLIWKPTYLWLTIPSARASVDRDIETVAGAAENIESHYAFGEVRFIQLHSENLALHKVFLSEQRYAWHDQSGAQLQVWEGNQRWEDWVLDLHHRFLLGQPIGLNIAGFSGLLLMPIALVGVVLWWPRRRSFSLDIRPKNAKRGAWLASHNNLGLLALLPILLTAFTGVVLVYPTESRWLLVNDFSAPKPPKVEVQSSNPELTLAELTWLAAFKYVQRVYPGSTLRWLSPLSASVDRNQEKVLKVGLQQAGVWNDSGSTSVRFKRDTIEIQDGLEQGWQKRAVDFTYPLHAAKLGLAYRFLLTLFGLMLTAVCTYGAVAFFKR